MAEILGAIESEYKKNNKPTKVLGTIKSKDNLNNKSTKAFGIIVSEKENNKSIKVLGVIESEDNLNNKSVKAFGKIVSEKENNKLTTGRIFLMSFNKELKPVLNKIIETIERKEALAREYLNARKNILKNPFVAGWADGLSIFWSHTKAYPESDIPERNIIACYFDGGKTNIDSGKLAEISDVSLQFITDDLIRTELADELRSWLAKKVQNESYGGLYNSSFQISLSVDVSRNVFPDDSPLMQGRVSTNVNINIEDRKRIELTRQRIHAFLLGENYTNCCIDEYSNSLNEVFELASNEYKDELGAERIQNFYKTLVVKSENIENEAIKIVTQSRLEDAYKAATISP